MAVDGAANAALLAIRILALNDPALRDALVCHAHELVEAVGIKDAAIARATAVLR